MRLYAIAGTLLALSSLLSQAPAQPGARLGERFSSGPGRIMELGATIAAASGGGMEKAAKASEAEAPQRWAAPPTGRYHQHPPQYFPPSPPFPLGHELASQEFDAGLTPGVATTGCATPAVTCCPPPAEPRRPVAELAAILDKTDNKDTFLLGVMTLRSMGPEAAEALPAILRNAERLGLLQGIAAGLCTKGKTAVSGATEEVRGAMLDIAACARDKKNLLTLPPCVPVQPAAPAVPQPVQTVPIPQVTPTTLAPATPPTLPQAP